MLPMKNKVHRVDGPFNEDSKNIILGQGGPNFGRGMARKFRKNGKTGKPIVMQIRKWSILIGNTGLYSIVSKSLHHFGFPAC